MLDSTPTTAGSPGSVQVTPALFVSLVTVAVSSGVVPCWGWALLVELLSVTPAVVPTGPVTGEREPPAQADSIAAVAVRNQAQTKRPGGAQADTLKSALLSRVLAPAAGRPAA